MVRMKGRLLVVANARTRSDDIARSVAGTDWDYEVSELGADALSAAIHDFPVVILLDAREFSFSHALFCQTLRELMQTEAERFPIA